MLACMRELRKRLNYVKGQLAGIEKMIAEGRNPVEIYTQLRSIESAFQKSILQTFEAEHRSELSQLLARQLEDCPGTCGHCEDVEAIRKMFPRLSMQQVLAGLQKFKGKEVKEDA